MGRHNKLPEGEETLDPAPPKRSWVKIIVSVPLLPVVALVAALGVVGYAWATSQISLNFAGPPSAQGAPQADAQDASTGPGPDRNQSTRASRGGSRAASGAVIRFRVTKRTATGFVATATVANQGAKPINGWVLGFKIPGVQVLSVGNATPIRKGKVAWVKNLATAPVLQPGQSVRVVFTAQGKVAKPSACRFNKVDCTLA